jgi:NAD(P)-dependent dehydrogenase (short-subunit alcohol dehydrogenase family)
MADESMDELGSEKGTDREGAYELTSSRVPLRRAGTPEEIASAAAWLASDDASFATGATIVLDGGNTVIDTSSMEFAT